MSKSIQLYHKLPYFLKQLICSYEGKKIQKRRYDDSFLQLLKKYNERTTISKEDLYQFRDESLIKFIHYAIDNIPFYKKYNKNDFKTFEDLSKLPLLTKETVHNNIEQFKSASYSQSDCITSHTSGTTGAGLVFPVSKVAEKHQWAVWWRYRNNLGIKFKTKCGIFTGQPILNPTEKNPPFWILNNANNEIIFSGYHLHVNNIAHYINAINKYKIEWLHGYPSNLALLAKLMSEANLNINHKIKIITTGAESLLMYQKNLIESQFQTTVYNHYGLAEAVVNISECKNGNLHVDEDFSAVELQHLEGNRYKIIGTNYHNSAFPLLRYDTGDIATIENEKLSCSCSYHCRIVTSIDGRKEDYIYLSDNVPIGRLDHLFKDLVHVKQAQIYQKEIGKMEIRIVKDTLYSNADEKKLISEINMRMGSKIEFKILYLDEIKKISRGKFRFILSDVKNNNIKEMAENY